MDTVDPIARAREAFERGEWADAYASLSAEDRLERLTPEDLERLATAAYLLGREPDASDGWARAHQAFLDRAEVERAVRCAFWLAFGLFHRGERARAGGWIARARRLLDERGGECVEQGYLLLPLAMGRIQQGDNAGALATFSEAAEIGRRFGDADLVALARNGVGRALLRLGEIDRGVGLMDEAMVAVEAGEVSTIVVGDVYCSVIEGCLEIHDLGRAQEWTSALSHWCESRPDMIPYSGECLVRRAELLRLHGAWPDAGEAARRACERFLAGPERPATGAAYYQRAELHRLRGELASAEEAYREASRWGRKPQPGLALLRLAQGRTGDAEAAIRRALDEAIERTARTAVLPAFVDIMLAVGDVEAAGGGAEELAELARARDAALLRALAGQARGAVLLAGGDARSALPELRGAWRAWEEVDAPYEAARVRVLVGVACRDLGDVDSARIELESARRVFRGLGAGPDLTRVNALFPAPPTERAHGLTRRQVQVLRLVASGRTNRAIAEELFISERTVARHVSNILGKLGLATRSAATAYAYEHDLL